MEDQSSSSPPAESGRFGITTYRSPAPSAVLQLHPLKVQGTPCVCCWGWGGVPRDPRPAWEAALVALAPSTKAPAWLLGRSLAGRAGRGIGWRARRPLAHQPGGAGAAGSWPPPLQYLPRCAPSAGIMGGPAAADAVVEAGRGRALGLEGRGGRVQAGSGSWGSPEAGEPKQENKTLEGAGAHQRWGGSWSRKMVPASLSSPGAFPSSASGPVLDCFAPCLLPACLISVFGFFCRWK